MLRKLLFLLLPIFLLAGERDSRWPALRKRYIVAHPQCEACGSLQAPQVHHTIPVNTDPSKELDYNNLITLCKKKCHLKIGHGGCYQYYNPNCRRDSEDLREGESFDGIAKRARANRIPNSQPKSLGEKFRVYLGY